jgi:hypothetical protein
VHVRYHLLQIVHQQTPMPAHPPDRQGPLISDLTNGVAAPAPPAVLTRTVTPTVPVRVTYEVTDLGRYPRPPALRRQDH